MKNFRLALTHFYPPHWVTATLAIVVIFVAIYALRADTSDLTPNEQMLRNAD